ncbi:MAG: hypothetical protein LAT68_10285 [Cyclobacteriaceae bacterium]|nr:hypothetical protein [Cyclobacteriaceae bacterium]MCH8516702.1 hypothetical protein [Cyclobacteriaceae bacterium]
MKNNHLLDKSFNFFLSPKVKHATERYVLIIAIIGFLIHLGLIVAVQQDWLNLESKLLNSPIAAIYTPFSFILVYEVYLLIFFLPKSISTYIGKQYEIITLIVIRRIFKDIANIELTTDWFKNQNDLQFTYDVLTSMILFLLIFFYYKKNGDKYHASENIETPHNEKLRRFINFKKLVAVVLVPILVMLAIFTFYRWASVAISGNESSFESMSNINNIFFDEFFTILIVVDVILLLFSFFYSDEFHKIIRNSGFIISTILIKISFSAEGLINNALVIGAVLFGFLMMIIHNMYQNHEQELDSANEEE